MWEIEFYVTSNGRCPVREFLDSLSLKVDLPYIDNALTQLEEYGNQLDRPKAAYLGDHIYELRVKTRSGQFRLLYFFFYEKKIILTNGFQKKSAKVPAGEMERAIEYRADYIKRKGKKR